MSNAARIAWICATALAVFVVWLATDASANAGIGFLYTVPIGLAAWWGGGRFAAITVASCVVLYNVGALIQPVPDFGLALAVRLIVFIGVAVVVCAIRQRVDDLEHSAEELEDIRAALTPSQLIDIPNVDVGTAFVPSDHGVSGDFFLVTNGPDGSTVAIVGDVVGHGPEAARLATFIRARFAAFAANTSDPGELLSLANGALIERPGPEHELVTAACLRFEAGARSSPGRSPATRHHCGCRAWKSCAPPARPSCWERAPTSSCAPGIRHLRLERGCCSTPTEPPMSAKAVRCSAWKVFRASSSRCSC